MNTAIQALGNQATDYAIKGALAYLKKHNAMTLANLDALEPHLKRCCKAAIGPALDDAKQALDAGMTDVALLTFKASMVNAGIAAAKTVHFVQQ